MNRLHAIAGLTARLWPEFSWAASWTVIRFAPRLQRSLGRHLFVASIVHLAFLFVTHLQESPVK